VSSAYNLRVPAASERVASYGHDVAALVATPGVNEPTYYPALQGLLSGLLRDRGLPFHVRVGTSQYRPSGGADMPDLALYDGAGEFPVVLGEVKLPSAELEDMAASTDRDDQIGRYLRRTGVVLLTNVRGFSLVVGGDARSDAPVPPQERRVLDTVELWPSASAIKRGAAVPAESAEALGDLLERAVTEFAAIAEPESLARILARQARRAKQDLPRQFSQAIRPLLDDFGKALGIHFEGADGEEFLRSSLIQTVFYGLFAAWTLWHRAGAKAPFAWHDISRWLRIPFLGALFHEFEHPSRLRELGLKPHLDAATATLFRVDTERFFIRFQAPGVSPGAEGGSSATTAILYFYEPFLEAFDPELRKQLGVWYTPWQIVRYQVRRVDQLLRKELACARGLADRRVVVLDPCCGTGAYLIEALRCVGEQLRSEGSGSLLPAELLDAVCRRLIGFEILTAPFVVAQLQIYLMLDELGAPPDEAHRPAVFLTNALTGWESGEQMRLAFPELQEEHDAARRVKREEPIIVVLGNPPYNRFAGVPLDEEASLVDHYKGIRRDAKGQQLGKSAIYQRWGVRKQLLDDLYIRFFRLAEVRIGEHAEHGIVSFISNSSFLAGRSHPLMRESLLTHFDDIWVDNLNGDKYRTGKVVPEGQPGAGSADQSAFTSEHDPRGIQVGTCITTFLKRGGRQGGRGRAARVHVRDFWGRAEAKRRALLESLGLDDARAGVRKGWTDQPEGPRPYQDVNPSEAAMWRLVSTTASGAYEDWPALDEVFPVSFQGVNPNRGLDGSVIDGDAERLARRMREYFSSSRFEDLADAHPELCKDRARYDARRTRDLVRRQSRFARDQIVPYLVFPMDLRHIYYEPTGKLLNEKRPELWANRKDNVFLLAVPQPRRVSESRPLVTSGLFDLHLHDRGSVGFPLRLLERKQGPDLFSGEAPRTGQSNLAPDGWASMKKAYGLKGDLTGPDAEKLVRRLFALALVVGHAPRFESDHAESLAQDWLHLPVPRDRAVLKECAALGERVAALLDPAVDVTGLLAAVLGARRRHLGVIETKAVDVVRESDLTVTIAYYGSAQGKWVPRRPTEEEDAVEAWGTETGDLWLNESVYVKNVPERVWRYELGGYPVVKQWLGYRQSGRGYGRPLTLAESDHLRGVIQRLAALVVLHDALDAAYEKAAANAFTATELGLK
jgi:hypothetical protein